MSLEADDRDRGEWSTLSIDAYPERAIRGHVAALPYIAGGMGISEDEASWVVTTYLVSKARREGIR